jgi:hypothetical protein
MRIRSERPEDLRSRADSLRATAGVLAMHGPQYAGAAALQRLEATLLEMNALLQEIIDGLWLTYLLAGAPYGETPHGLLRWFESQVPAQPGNP